MQLPYFCFNLNIMKYIAPFVAAFIITACNNNKTGEQVIDSNVVSAPPSISYNIVNTYPHDTTSFTEGLQLYNNELYESTGNKGESKLLRVDLKSGKVTQELALNDEYFGEGLTVLRDTIYQMTWQEKVGFVYDAKTFKLIRTFVLDRDGWGMTTDGQYLITSDGTSNIAYREPSTFRTMKIVSVTDNNGPVGNINELELVKGYLYANIWNTNYIVRIDPASGKVVGKMDLSGVLEQAAKQTPDPNRGNVLNGIAYDSVKNSFLLTGKYWPVLLEVKLN